MWKSTGVVTPLTPLKSQRSLQTGYDDSMAAQINKSTRHSHICGSFGEQFVCNWLSRSGFEVCIVDHTGIDILAYHAKHKRRLGISVKTRTRIKGTETQSVFLFRKPDDRMKLSAACEAFGCEPWLAIYVESETGGDLFLTSLENYDKRSYRVGAATEAWGMNPGQINRYAADPAVRHIHVDLSVENWW